MEDVATHQILAASEGRCGIRRVESHAASSEEVMRCADVQPVAPWVGSGPIEGPGLCVSVHELTATPEQTFAGAVCRRLPTLGDPVTKPPTAWHILRSSNSAAENSTHTRNLLLRSPAALCVNTASPC